MTVVFIDTSVLCYILRVPGRDQDADAVIENSGTRTGTGERFILPLTTIVETGNHVANIKPANRAVASRYTTLLQRVLNNELPWILNTVEWGAAFVDQLLAGDSTGEQLLNLLGTGRMGVGDVSILVERDEFVRRSAYQHAVIWTLEDELRARS